MNRLKCFSQATPRSDMYFQCYYMSLMVPSGHPVIPDHHMVLSFTRTPALDTLYWFLNGKNPAEVFA